jgi:serine O-acetyltransferase
MDPGINTTSPTRQPVDLFRKYGNQTIFSRIWNAGHALQRLGVPYLPKLLDVLCRVVFAADIPVRADIGRGVIFMHNGLGTAVHSKVVIRGPAIIFQNVTIGESMGSRPGTPVIGRDVVIGAGAVLIGPITVGDGCIIGANAVVLRDVPPGSIAVGAPAEVRQGNLRLVESHFYGEPLAELPSAA